MKTLYPKTRSRSLGLLLLILLVTLSGGCGWIIHSEPPYVEPYDSECIGGGEKCSPTCATICDNDSCWEECIEECWYEPRTCTSNPSKPGKKKVTETTETTEETTETTTTTCIGDRCKKTTKKNKDQKDKKGRGEVGSRCFNDHDCKDAYLCLKGICSRRGTKEKGVAGLCQVCESSNDCFEDGAKCVQINYDNVRRVGEKICARACRVNTDCPHGFQCVKTSNEPGDSAQCIPNLQVVEGKSLRTCNSTPDIECVTANDCSAGQSCMNNQCKIAQSVECIADSHCKSPLVCRNQTCVKPIEKSDCLLESDCSKGMQCISGKCQQPNGVCSSNADCSPNSYCDDGRCVDIQCRFSSDCSIGHICVNAQCKVSCSSSKDCSDNMHCNSFNYCAPE